MNNPMDENEMMTPEGSSKKKPIIIAALAVAAFLVVLAIALVILFACEGDGGDGGSNEPSGDVGATSDYFVADPTFEKALYTLASDLEGEVLDVFADKSLVAVLVKDLDNYNYDVDTVKIIDVTTGAVLHEKSVRNPRGERVEYILSAKFCDTCGIFEIRVDTTDDPETADVDEAKTTIEHYTSKSTPALLGTTDVSGHRCKSIGDVFAISLKNVDEVLSAEDLRHEISFFDEDMNLLSDYNGDFLHVEDIPYLSADSYIVSENEGYFYFFTENEALVFNINGFCTAEYERLDTRSNMMQAYVLNDGDLLIQYVRTLKPDAEEYDFRIMKNLYQVVSVIVDHKSGEHKEIELDYLVSALSPAYEDASLEKGFPFLLSEGKENQAYITRFENGVLLADTEYVVLDNEGKVEYTYPAEYSKLAYEKSKVIDTERVIFSLRIGDSLEQLHLFDVTGKYISAFPEGDVKITDTYIVTERMIYNHAMEAVYNFAGEGFTRRGVCGDVVYLTRMNDSTLKTETYKFDKTSSEPVLVCDGFEYLGFTVMTDNYCVAVDGEGWQTLYNSSGEAVSKTDGYMQITVLEGALLVENTVGSVTRAFVILDTLE